MLIDRATTWYHKIPGSAMGIEAGASITSIVATHDTLYASTLYIRERISDIEYRELFDASKRLKVIFSAMYKNLVDAQGSGTTHIRFNKLVLTLYNMDDDAIVQAIHAVMNSMTALEFVLRCYCGPQS